MEKISPYSEERWLLSNTTQDEYQEDDMLSLSDLPLHHSSEKQEKVDQTIEEEEGDFNFCRSKFEMCCADEVFFHGQILPLRHSVSSEKGLMFQYGEQKPSISRSESMDHRFYSSTLVSSRSSSISQSSSSGSSTKTLKLPQSHFFAHPSPSPRVHNYSRSFLTSNGRYSHKANKSSVWRIFRMGLIATPQPEIAIQDLKTRTNTLGSRKSNASSSTSSKSSNKQKKSYNFLSGGGCKCAVDDIVPSSRVVLPKQEEGKNKLSHRRTFEWLKQLSLEVEATR